MQTRLSPRRRKLLRRGTELLLGLLIAGPQSAPGQTTVAGLIKGTIVDAEANPNPGVLVIKAPMTEFNGVQALDYDGNPSLAVEQILNVAAINAVTYVPNPNGVHIKVNLAVGIRVSGERDVYTVLDSDELYAYDQGSGPAPSPVTYAAGPDLPQHTPGFPQMRMPAYVLSDGFLRAVYEIHNANPATDDPIYQITPSGPALLAAPGGTLPNNPPRPEPTPPGQGTTYLDVSKPTIGANYAAWLGNANTFGGTFTRRHSDGAQFRVVGADGLDFSFGSTQTTAFHGDELVISTGGTSAGGGVYRAHPEGVTPAELILPHRFSYDPNDPSRQFRDGTVRDIDGDRAVIIGRAEGSVPAMFLWNIVDGKMLEILRGGTSIPGGGTFTSFDQAAITVRGSDLSQSRVAFTGRDQNFAPAGLFVYLDGKIIPIVRPGESVGGREVQAVDFQGNAFLDSTLAYATKFSDGGSAAWIGEVVDLSIKGIRRATGIGMVIEGKGVPDSSHTVLATDDLSQPFTPYDTTVADSNGDIVFTDQDITNEFKRLYKFQAQYYP